MQQLVGDMPMLSVTRPQTRREPLHLAAPQPSGSALNRRFRSAAAKTLEARDHLFFEGDEKSHAYLVEKGSVCLYKTLPDGRRQIFGFAYAGDFIALDCSDSHSHNAQALNLTRLRCLPAHVLKEVGRSDPEAGLQLYTTLSEHLMAARDLLSTVGQRSAAERLAGLLLALARRNERNGVNPWKIQLPMTRLDIADFLSLTIETVSRTFTKFRQDQLIGLTHSTLVTVLNPQELESLAAGDRD
jgi:CRP/FNR family transcriptional regulator